MFRLRIPFAVALLLAIYFGMAVSASRSKGPTFDEIVHVTAGYNSWVNHDQRFDPGNGDFVKRWASLPLLGSRPKFPPTTTEDWKHGEFFLVSRDFMFGQGNDPDAILLCARAMVAVFGVGLGLLVFACARQLFGVAGGFVSLTAFVFSPDMLAHGALVSTDLTAAFALFAATWFAWRLLHVVSWNNLIGSVVAFSILLISKMSAVLIVPIVAVLIIIRYFNRDPWLCTIDRRWTATSGRRHGTAETRPEVAFYLAGRTKGAAFAVLILLHALAGWFAIWAVFDFKYFARANPSETHLTMLRSSDAPVDGLISRTAQFCHDHHLLPEGYLKGMEELVGISKRRPSFMNGHWKAGGRAMFFPYALWAKTSPALLVLVALGLAAIVFRKWSRDPLVAEKRGEAAASPQFCRRSNIYALTPLFVLFAIYAAVAIRQGVNIGHRHILPLYPVMFVLAGASAMLLASAWRKSIGVIVAVLLIAHGANSLNVRPDYLAYFSPLVGGPSHGYQRLVDSSLDWGQDLPGLRDWLATHEPTDDSPVFLSYFGTGDPEYYGIKSQRLPGFPEWRPFRVFAYTPGYYAVSATMFQQVYAMTFGPWNRVFEEEYQARVKHLGLTPENTEDTGSLVATLQRLPDDTWQQEYGPYEKLRFARLCAWLRATHRTPDAQLGYSILVWKLSDADLRAALWDRPLELYERPAGDLPDGI